MRKYIICLITIVLLFQGCSKNDMSEDLSESKNSEVETSNDELSDTDEKAPQPTSTPTPQPTPEPTPEPTPVPELILPLVENDSGKVRIQTASRDTTYPYNSYIISSVNGENVVVDPTSMPKKDVVDIAPVAIISTHSHPDHIDSVFSVAYDCHKLNYKRGEIQTDDFNIYSIPSAHDGDIVNETSQNILVVFEVDGLRIAHMGDVGQTAFTEEQLTELGEIDIAFMQFENGYSSMTLKNEKGFNLIEQLNPTVVIPTHYTSNTLPVLEEKYGAITKVVNMLEITKEELPDGSMNIYIITNEHKYF